MACNAISGNNNPADQCVTDKGPIPTGRWLIGVPIGNGTLDEKWARLTEVSGNNTNCQCMSDRTGIYIHGGTESEGCITIKSPKCTERIVDSLTKEKGGDLLVTEQ